MFEKLFGLAAEKELKVPVRGAKAAYMNLAYQKLATITGSGGVCDQNPSPLSILTDEGNKENGFTTVLEHSSNGEHLAIEINLGQEFEVYEIILHHKSGAGYKKAATDQIVKIRTYDGSGAFVDRDAQTVTGDNAYHDNTLHYVGEGIPVKHVQVRTTMTSANKFSLDLSEIEVFGC